MKTTRRDSSGRITKIIRRDANGRILPVSWKGPYVTGSKAKGRHYFAQTGLKLSRQSFLKRSRSYIQTNPQLADAHLPITHNKVLLKAKTDLLWRLNKENKKITRKVFDKLVAKAEKNLWKADAFQKLLVAIGAREPIEPYSELRRMGIAA